MPEIPAEAVQAAIDAFPADPRVMLDERLRLALEAAAPLMAGAGSPTTCPSAASESTESAQTTPAAPVYHPTPAKPAETLTALRDTIARAIAHRAGSQAFNHTDRAWDDLRNRWLSYADAALEVLDGAGAVPGEHTGAQQPLQHAGGNAEDCPACDITTLPYPFLCPGGEYTGSGNG